jgi:hypothetical protein
VGSTLCCKRLLHRYPCFTEEMETEWFGHLLELTRQDPELNLAYLLLTLLMIRYSEN